MGPEAAEAYLLGLVHRGRCLRSQPNHPTGKILKDEETVESYKIEEKGFVVCMVNKVRVAATPRPSARPAS